LAGRGIQPYGEGFILELDDPILERLNNAEKRSLRPFVNGQTLMSGTPSGRVVIDAGIYSDESGFFDEMPTLAGHLRATVKPVRDAITSQIHEHRYWAFWDKRENLFRQIDQIGRFITLAGDTRVPVFLFWEDRASLLSHKVVIIASDSPSVIGTLSSTVHSSWFEKLRTGRGATSNYVVSRCLRTFPFPDLDHPGLLQASEKFLAARDNALERVISATTLYNLMDDPECTRSDVERLREAQMQMDAAVLDSFGWGSLRLRYGYFELAGVRRFTCTPSQRDEIRRLLFDENSRRDMADVVANLKKTSKARNRESAPGEMETLFS
jgi:hypothetical protein